MAHVLERLTHPHINPALAIGVVWGALALAVAVYDIGRWLNAW